MLRDKVKGQKMMGSEGLIASGLAVWLFELSGVKQSGAQSNSKRKN